MGISRVPSKPVRKVCILLYRKVICQLPWMSDMPILNRADDSNLSVLNLDATSRPAFQTLLFLHLHTDDYASALTLLTDPPSESLTANTKLDFERAYCMYRLHREKEALEVLQGIEASEGGRKVEHLEAQIVSISPL